jgi:iron complex outermembrane receptor protein
MRGSYLLALLASASTIAIAAPAFAAEAPPSQDTTTVNEVVVTAEKKTEILRDVPMSISALPQDQLEKQVDRSFTDFSALVPGLVVQETQPGDARLTLRGLNSGGVAATVGVYVDDSPFGSSSGLVNGAVLAGDFDTFDMKRIEVLRGPQGTLYGANTEGGVLKFVTNAPNPTYFSSAFETGYDSVTHGGSGWDVSGMINVPLGDTAALRIVAYHDALPGWVNNVGTHQKDINAGDKDGGRISFLWKPVDSLSIRLTAFDQEIHTGGSATVDVDPVTLKPVFGGFTQDRLISEPNQYRYQNFNALVSWSLPGGMSLVSSTSYSINHTFSRSDASGDVQGAIPDAGAPGGFDYITLQDEVGGAGADFDNRVNVNKTTEELRLSSGPSDRVEWTVGGFVTRETGSIVQAINVFDPGTGAILQPNLEVATVGSTYKEYAGFGNVTVKFGPAFDVQVGGRWSHNSQVGAEFIDETNLGGGLVRFSVPSSESVFNFSVAPRWHIDANNMLYGRIASGYTPGGPNVLPPNVPPGTPFTYKSDSTVNYEIGLKGNTPDQHFSYDVAVFLIDWKDIQLFEEVNNVGINGNGGTARSMGGEATFTWVPIEGLNLVASGSYTDAHLTSDAPGVNGHNGDQLPWTPKFQGTLDGEYDWSLTGDLRAFVGGTVAYVGDRVTDFAAPPGALLGRRGVPDYTTTGLRAGVDRNRWRLEVYGKNLGDERGITNLSAQGAILGLNRSAGYIQPQTFGVVLSAKF